MNHEPFAAGAEPIRVLIVDNERLGREYLAETLRQPDYGFEVETARDGDECIKCLSQTDGNFDVILMDLLLGPGPNGLEVMKLVKERHETIEVIILTHQGGVEVGLEAMNEGAFTYLTKHSAQEEVLVVHIRSAARQRRIRRQLLRAEWERSWLKALRHISHAVATSVRPEEVARVVYKETQRLLPNMNTFYIAVYDEHADEVKFTLTVEDGKEVRQEPRVLTNPDDWGLTGDIIKNKRHIIRKDLREDAELQRYRRFGFNRPAVSYVGLPLTSQGKLIGVLSAQSYEAGAFTDDHLSLLDAIANQVAVTLHNALLHQQREARLNVLKTLYRTLADLRESYDLVEILDGVVDNLQKLFGLDTCTIGLFDPTKQRIDFVAARGLNQTEQVSRLVSELPRHLHERIAASNELIVIEHLDKLPQLRDSLVRRDLKSFALLPLKDERGNGQGLLGVITMGSKGRIAVPDDEEQQKLLTALANQAAIAVERARLHGQTQDLIKRLGALAALTLRTATQHEIEEMLHAIIEHAAALLNATGGGIYLLTGDGDELRLEASYGMEHGIDGMLVGAHEGVIGEVLRTGAPYAQADYYRWAGRLKSLDKFKITAVVAAPILAGDRPIGVLAVHDTREGSSFTEAQKDVLLIFGRHAGAAIETAKLMEEQKVIKDVTGALASVLDHEELLNKILDVLHDWLGGDLALALMLKNKAANTLYVEASKNYPPEAPREFRMGEGITGVVAASGRPELVPDVDNDRRYVRGMPSARSELAVPLLVRGEIVGVLDIESSELNAFSERHEQILMQAAAVIARTIENKESLRRLHEVGISITSMRDYRSVLESVVEHARALLNAEVCSIFLVQREGFISLEADSGSLPGSFERGKELEIRDEERSGLTGAIVARAIAAIKAGRTGYYFNEHGESLLGDPATRYNAAQTHLPRGCTSLLAVPLLRREGERTEVIGLIKAQNRKDLSNQADLALRFDETDKMILETLAGDAVAAIQNARLNSLSDMSHRVARVVNSKLELDEVLRLVLSQLKSVLKFDTASIQLLRGAKFEIKAAEGFPAKAQPGVLKLVFPLSDVKFPNTEVYRRRAPYLIPDIQEEPRYRHFWEEPDVYFTHNIRTWLGVPLLFDEKVIGMLSIESYRPRSYNSIHVELAEAFASQVASAVANAQRYRSWQSMLRFIEEFSKQDNLVSLLQKIAEDALREEAINADTAIIHIYDPLSQGFTTRVHAGEIRHLKEAMRPITQRSAVHKILFESKQERVKTDVSRDKLLYRGFAKREQIKSVGAYPLFDENQDERQPVGVMFFNFRSRRPFTPEDKELMGTFARDAAHYIQLARRFEKFKEHIQQAHNKMAMLLAMSAWAHNASSATMRLSLNAVSLPKLIGRANLSPNALETLEMIESDAEAISALIPDAPEDFNNKEEVYLEDAFQQALEAHAEQLREKEIAVAASLRKLPPVWASQWCVVRVFGHLIQNAVRAMEPGGRLTVKGWVEGGHAYVRVSDTGRGVPDDVAESIGKTPVYSDGDGMGAGLVLTQLSLTIYDGDLLPPRSTRRGSSFTFYLPLAA